MEHKRKWILLLCLLVATALRAQVTVKGTVTDTTGEPLPGVKVQVVGVQGSATVTNFDGLYSIKADPKAQLQFSYIGFASQVVPVAGKTTIDIELKDETEEMQEVVVVGYGTVKKESLTGSVATVDSKAFEGKGSLASPLEALQGQVAGVLITRSSSAPGEEGWEMKLRGSVSKNSGGPLVIIDGVAGDMGSINPADIESINFLKDGAAAIYGSRAADGVVIITTKKGAEGKVKVNYTGSVTIKTPGLQPETMSLGQWADGLMQTLRNDNNTSNVWYTYAQLAKQYQGRYIDLGKSANPFGTAAFTDVADFVFSDVDWLGGLFGNALNQEHNLSVSGGGEKNAYRVSLGYNYDGSNLQYGNNSNRRINFRINDTYKFSKRLSLQSSIAYYRKQLVSPTMIGSALTATLPQPGLPMAAIDGKPYAWGTWGSPVAKVENGGDKTTSVSRIDISETLNYDITDWLTANVNLGYNTADKMVDEVQNAIQYYNITGERATLTDPVQAKSYYQQSSQRIDNYSVTGYLNGHKRWGDHNTSLTLGTQYEFKEAREFGVKATDILEGLEVVNGTGDVTIAYNSKYQNAILSFFGRANYDYKGRYLVELIGRYDGSSKFLPENRWDFFWEASAGWRLTEEKFMQDVKWLTNLKLRASYAQVGNQSGIGNYDGVQLYNVHTNSGAYLGSNLASYIATNGTFASKTRSWERIKNYNVAADFGIRLAPGHNINGTVEYFQKRNDNMLVSVTLPGTLGDAAPSANVGKFKDYGWEWQVTYNGKVGKVDYHVGGTFTFARNKLTEYEGTTVKSVGYTSNMVGYGIASLFGYRYAGKIQNEDQLAAYKALYYENNGIGMPSNLRVGDNMYCDENHDGRLDENDLIFLGSSEPEISYSFNAGASWNGFDLNIVFQGAANRFIYRGNDTNWTVPYRGLYVNNLNSSIGNTWTPDNTDAYYAPYTNDGNINRYNYQASTLTAQDGRYLRLKNITVGYTFPQKMLKKSHFIEGLRLYFTGTDLWEATRIKDGWDPESKISKSGISLYPFTRNYTVGVNVTF
ncbi:MAG: TonB-dependent receptor [Bacteroidaceae bacterium]|nr:TonB-dependent receptor [Bacteroidaceae bacterium]